MTQTTYKRSWPLLDFQAVCRQQSTVAAGSLVLNGTLYNPLVNGISFFNNGFIKTVSLTSLNNLSGVNFTIDGFQNGVAISETISGPDNSNTPNPTTTYTTISFDSITSITVDGAVNAVSVGTGNSGYLPLIGVNNKGEGVPSWGLSVWLPITNESGITYEGFLTIDDIINNGFTYDEMIYDTGQIYNIILQNSSSSQFLSHNGVDAKYILLRIITSTNISDDVLYATFLQANG